MADYSGKTVREMKSDQMDKLLSFTRRLARARIPYQVQTYREDAITVGAKAPGEYWEIDFLADGQIDIERYRSNGKIFEEPVLEELFALCSDEDAPIAEPVTDHATTA